MARSPRERQRLQHMDKFVGATIRDEIETREKEMKNRFKQEVHDLHVENDRLRSALHALGREAEEMADLYKAVSRRDLSLAALVSQKFKDVRLQGHPLPLTKCERLNFLVTRNEFPVYPADYDKFLQASQAGLESLEGTRWEESKGVKRNDLDRKCPVCQEYIGLLPFICPGTCTCKYHISCIWPASSRRSICGACKVSFVSRMFDHFYTKYIPPAEGSINLDTGAPDLDKDAALDNEIMADILAGRRDSLGPNPVDRAHDDDKEEDEDYEPAHVLTPSSSTKRLAPLPGNPWTLFTLLSPTTQKSIRPKGNVKLYHLDSSPGKHAQTVVSAFVKTWLHRTIQNVGTPRLDRIVPIKVIKQKNPYDYGVHVMALTRLLIEKSDTLASLLETDGIRALRSIVMQKTSE
ncbi:hypothetical protein R1sor_016182 [Riccia sorocarpa]|uniref:RING-type domain-containing protein n=1 Tax=Riccia sorocarpa TaxID=122646 RepID=A0ABD3HEP6_9MARC